MNSSKKWGLITYEEKALLYKENVSTAVDKNKIAMIISHELAHQWFGNIFGLKIIILTHNYNITQKNYNISTNPFFELMQETW